MSHSPHLPSPRWRDLPAPGGALACSRDAAFRRHRRFGEGREDVVVRWAHNPEPSRGATTHVGQDPGVSMNGYA